MKKSLTLSVLETSVGQPYCDIFNMVAVQTIPVLKVSNIFSWILIIMNMRLKFQSTGHLKPSKYLY